MHNKLRLLLVFCFSAQLLLSNANVLAADPGLIWYNMDTTESKESKEPTTAAKVDNSSASNEKSTEQPQKASEDIAKTEKIEVKSDDIAATIEAIQKKRKEEDAQLQQLLLRQKEQQRIKEEEAKRKEEDRKQKDEEQKRLISELTVKQEQQKKEVSTIVEELKKQNAEQQNQQAKIIADLLEELRKKQVAEQVVQAAQPAVVITPILETSVKDNIQDQIKSSTQDGSLAPSTEADISFKYSAGSLFRIHTKMGYLTDIQLQPGEDIIYVGGGDSSRWLIEKAQSGSAEGQVWHLYIKPTAASADTNIVMTTTKRSYQLLVMADSWYNPIVKWTYPNDGKRLNSANNAEADRKEGTSDYSSPVSDLNFDYEVSGKSYIWSPKLIWDDGKKTYIRMPGAMINNEAPVLFIRKGDNGLAMVNYRLVNGCFVVDRLFEKAELRNGKEVIKIQRSKNGG